MQDHFTIRTPDHVELEFEPAGPVSRLAALFFDGVLITAAIFLIVLFLILMGLLGSGANLTQSLQAMSWAAAAAFLLIFLVSWGYYLTFEMLLRGLTPGKRLMGIRVLRDDGLPVGLRECAVRNLVRAADMMPFPTYLLGGLVALYQRRGKRLGDMAAGTVVVREAFVAAQDNRAVLRSGASWMARLEAGQSRQAVTLPAGKIGAEQVALIQRFMSRRFKLPALQRGKLAWQITRPFLELMGEDEAEVRQRADRRDYCERILRQILEKASAQPVAQASQPHPSAASGEEKGRHWTGFSQRAAFLLKRGRTALRSLTSRELTALIRDYRRIIADLARARSLGADQATRAELNRMAVAGHNLLYGQVRPPATQSSGLAWWAHFPLAVRRHLGPVGLSALFLFGPALISYLAVQWHPELGYELVAEGFLEFEPARQENLHDIPPLARPVAASAIMTNNVQVTLMAFGLGLTAGLGTSFILIFNGIHLGSVAGWMALKGNSRAFWGWVMPHGGTELLAIVLAGGAGFILAGAIISPGLRRRSQALKEVGMKALTIELGCMVMLVIAGLIEGFVSPSSIGYPARIAILSGSLAFWLLYLGWPGRFRAKAPRVQ